MYIDLLYIYLMYVVLLPWVHCHITSIWPPALVVEGASLRIVDSDTYHQI